MSIIELVVLQAECLSVDLVKDGQSALQIIKATLHVHDARIVLFSMILDLTLASFWMSVFKYFLVLESTF